MSTAEADEVSEVLDRVKHWPPPSRIALARDILDSLMSTSPTTPSGGETIDTGTSNTPGWSPRGVSVGAVTGLLKTDQPAPDDETVRRRLEERRIEKYG